MPTKYGCSECGEWDLGRCHVEPSPRHPRSCLQRFPETGWWQVRTRPGVVGGSGRGSPGFPGGSWRVRHFGYFSSAVPSTPRCPLPPRPAFGPYCGARIPEGCSWGMFCVCSAWGTTPRLFRRCRERPLGRAGPLPPTQLRQTAPSSLSCPRTDINLPSVPPHPLGEKARVAFVSPPHSLGLSSPIHQEGADL